MSEPRPRVYSGPTHPAVRGWETRGATTTHRRGSRQALCAWLPTFELRLELVRSPELDTTSVALLSAGENTRRTVWQVSERAAIAGVRPGQLISQAIALCPSLTLLEPDPAHYDTAQEELLETLSNLSPIVEPAGRGRVFVGMDGLGRLYGSPTRQIDRVLGALLTIFPRPLVAAMRMGWAPGKFGAWVAAAGAGPGQPVVVRDEELLSFLGPCPVSVLPVDTVVVERLERLGVKTLDDLIRLPTPALVGQFGSDGRKAREWATGERIDSVQPYHRPRPIRSSLDFHTPVGQVGNAPRRSRPSLGTGAGPSGASGPEHPWCRPGCSPRGRRFVVPGDDSQRAHGTPQAHRIRPANPDGAVPSPPCRRDPDRGILPVRSRHVPE